MASLPELSEAEHELQAAQIELDKINTTLKMYRAVGNGQFQILAPKTVTLFKKI